MTETPAPARQKQPRVGIVYAAIAALLFGLSTPLAKLLLGNQPPILLAGLLYLGSGLGLMTTHVVRRMQPRETAPVPRGKWPWLAGAVVFGGVVAPVLFMTGLAKTSGSTASLSWLPRGQRSSTRAATSP